MTRQPLFLAALLASIAKSSPAIADEPTTAIAVVQTADLDLGKARDVRTLDQRLGIAIVQACGEASNIDLAGRNAVRACRVDARSKINAERERLIQLAQRDLRINFASAH